MRLPAAVALVLQGAILFFMLGGALFTQYRLRLDWPALRKRAQIPPQTAGGDEP